MDNQAIASSDALYNYSTALLNFISSISDEIKNITSVYCAAGSSWRDDVYESFGKFVDELKSKINGQLDKLIELEQIVAAGADELWKAEQAKKKLS